MSSVTQQLEAVLPLNGQVAVIGSANADLTVRVGEMPKPGQTIHGGPLATLPGGKSANQAVAVALLGAPTTFIGAVGNDDNGTFLLNSLQNAGVNTEYVRRVETPTSCAVITVDSHAENMIIVTEGANGTVDLEVLESARPAVERANALGLALEIPLETVVAAAQMAKEAGTITVFNPSPLPDAIPPELLRATDVLMVNEGEMTSLVGASDEDWESAEKALKNLGVQRAVVTLGPRGAMVLDNGATFVGTIDVPVTDTTGCGDSFMGGVLAALASGSNLTEAAEFASAVASYAAAGMGAQASYGTLEQIRERFASA